MKNLNLTNVKSALVSAVLMGVLAMTIHVVELGNVFAIEWPSLANVGILSFLTGLVSILKSVLTSDGGTVAGLKIRD